MSIVNKVLIGLIIVASLGLFYMSARALKTDLYWSQLAEKHDEAIQKLQQENKVLQEGESIGGETKPGIDQLRSDIKQLTSDRGRVWYGCEPTVDVNRQTGAVSVKVSVDDPQPHGVADKTLLYVFEEPTVDQKGRFLGEFKVNGVTEKELTLDPAFKLLPSDVDKLASAKHPWTLYDAMPRDNHEVFSQLNENDKKALLPAESQTEYVKDGQSATANDPANRVADGKYERPLRDYELLLNSYRMKITLLIDQEQAAIRDNKMVENALADAKRQVQFYQDQVTVFQAISDKYTRQRDAVVAHLEKLKDKINSAKDAINMLIENNKAMAGQIAKIQLDATRLIDERVHAMAQSASGEK